MHPGTLRWARTALARARIVAADPQVRAQNLRHGGTWFVGVDALNSGAWGVVDGCPLEGAFLRDLAPVKTWCRAQLSIVYPGYPGRDPGDDDAAYRYRLLRAAAHVDGLLAVGPERRRFPLERHAFILGLPLTEVRQSPTLCWPGSHWIIGEALRAAIGSGTAADTDVTEAYTTARGKVMATIRPVPLIAPPGGAFLLHRFLLHGTAPWEDDTVDAPDGRMVAFFRPEVANDAQWLLPDWTKRRRR
ncbi:MAG: hypothetical protein CML68_07855 [Rhodobacteraceae bacterium]|nr:hypothetical protein [Paracoccaceae bacterium]